MILQQSLTSGNTSRCNDHPKNDYVLKGGYVLLDVSTSNMPDTHTKLDIDDLDRVIRFKKHNNRLKWMAHNDHYGKWGTYVSATDRKTRLHRFVMGVDDPQLIIDHINGDTLDNRKSNLRVTTRAENNKNMRLRDDNITGCHGLTYNEGRDNYSVSIQLNSKKHFIGTYNNARDAKIAYKAAAKLLGFSDRHGEPEC